MTERFLRAKKYFFERLMGFFFFEDLARLTANKKFLTKISGFLILIKKKLLSHVEEVDSEIILFFLTRISNNLNLLGTTRLGSVTLSLPSITKLSLSLIFLSKLINGSYVKKKELSPSRRLFRNFVISTSVRLVR